MECIHLLFFYFTLVTLDIRFCFVCVFVFGFVCSCVFLIYFGLGFFDSLKETEYVRTVLYCNVLYLNLSDKQKERR